VRIRFPSSGRLIASWRAAAVLPLIGFGERERFVDAQGGSHSTTIKAALLDCRERASAARRMTVTIASIVGGSAG
jgi:hypothetical protein